MGQHSEHLHIYDRIYVVMETKKPASFSKNACYEYITLHDSSTSNDVLQEQVGPLNLGTIYDVCQTIDTQLRATDRPIALIATPNTEMFNKSVLTLGAYVMMHCNRGLDVTMGCIRPLLQYSSESTAYANNASINESYLDMQVQDCLGGLLKAKSIGWVDFMLGGFDADEYKHLNSPLNADLHEIIPGKLVIMRGPRELPNGATWHDAVHADGRIGPRDFSAAYFADILDQLDVQAVVRCSETLYDCNGFEKAGIAVVELYCEEHSPPTVDVISKFLAVAERLPGAIALHDGPGSGWSGTLAALYMMKHHGFTAREAIGWLQIVRPGRCEHLIGLNHL
jgi:cell division cycle 14